MEKGLLGLGIIKGFGTMVGVVVEPAGSHQTWGTTTPDLGGDGSGVDDAL